METQNVNSNNAQVIPMHRDGGLEKAMNKNTNVTTKNVGLALRKYIMSDDVKVSNQLKTFFYGHDDSKLVKGCGLCEDLGGCELINMKNVYDMYWSNQYSRDEALKVLDQTLGRHSQVLGIYNDRIKEQQYWASLNHRLEEKVVGFP